MKWIKGFFSIVRLNAKNAQLKTEIRKALLDEARWRKERNEFQAKYLALRETLKRLKNES